MSGPPDRNIDQISSYIVSQEKETGRLVLYFFFSADINVSAVIRTLLKQIVRDPPIKDDVPIIQAFLYKLLREFFPKQTVPNWEELGLVEREPLENIQKILEIAPAKELFTAFKTVLPDEAQRGLSIVIDRLDKVEHQRNELMSGIQALVKHLQKQTSKAKILLTSRPMDEVEVLLKPLPRIEYDRERRGLSTSPVPTLAYTNIHNRRLPS